MILQKSPKRKALAYPIFSTKNYLMLSGLLITAAFDVALTLAGVQVLGIDFEGNVLAKFIYNHTYSYPLSIIGGKVTGLSLVTVPLFSLLKRGYVLTFHTVTFLAVILQVSQDVLGDQSDRADIFRLDLPSNDSHHAIIHSRPDKDAFLDGSSYI